MIDTSSLKQRHSLVDVAARYGVALKRKGHEWHGCCPFHAEETPSFTIREGRSGQQFHCFGCGADGDVIRFVQQYEGVPFAEAVRRLSGGVPPSTAARAAPVEKRQPADVYAGWRALPPPAGAPPILPGQQTPELFNPKAVEKPVTRYSSPVAVYPYTDADERLIGYVLRIEINGRKLTPLILWCEHEDGRAGWTHFPMPNPRPLYRLERLRMMPQAQVLLVEGEKCADAAFVAFPDMACLSWQGGAQGAKYADWSLLAGRRVVLWPDADAADEHGNRPGIDTMHEIAGRLLRLECELKWIEPPADMPDGWDVADALTVSGWTRDEVRKFGKATAKPYIRPKRRREPSPGGVVREALAPDSRPAEVPNADANRHGLRETGNVVHLPNAPDVLVRDRIGDYEAALIKDAHGNPKPKLLQNFEAVARYHPHLHGVFWYNTFDHRVYLLRQPPWDRHVNGWKPRPFQDRDISQFAMHLERLGFTPTLAAAQTAIISTAEVNSYDPLLEYLHGLKWDGQKRLRGAGPGKRDGWLTHYAGAEQSPYHRAVGMRWMIAAVARAHATAEAPVKVDTILVLEGPQSAYKSTLLRELGTLPDGRTSGMLSTFSDDISEIKSKDAMQLLQGSWIVELAEMTALGKDVNGDKQWITKQVDKFRPPFGKTNQSFPRRCIFSATTNPHGNRGYLKDATGARRFWPVRVDKIDIERIRADRDQLWAEAVALYQAGEQWWLTPDEERAAAVEQDRRYLADPWEGKLLEFARTAFDAFTIGQAFEALGVGSRDWTEGAEARVTKILTRDGFDLDTDHKGRSVYRRGIQ